MSQSKYIKVTPKGEKEGRVVLASLKSFFVSQGAKIEQPTTEEIVAAFPEEHPNYIQKIQMSPAQANEQSSEIVDHLNLTIKEQKATIAKLEEELREIKDEREKLYQQIAAQGASLQESEQLIAKLRADADKGVKSTGKEKGE